MRQRIHPDIRAVFFDAVGTLLFPEPAAPVVYAEAARRHQLLLSPDDVRERFVEAYRTQELADRVRGWQTSEGREHDRWHRIVTETLRGVADPDGCFRELYEHFAQPSAWRVDRDTGHLLTRLRERGLVVGLGSNYDARLWSVLEGFPALAPVSGRVVVSAAIGFRKPAAEFFHEVVRVAGCLPQEVLFVGDDLDNDYVGATAAGLPAVLFDEGNTHRSVPNRIRRLTDLLGTLGVEGPNR